MELTEIRELYRNREAFTDKEVTVGGWVRSNRDSKTFGFIVINDGTFFETLQIVYSDKLANFDQLQSWVSVQPLWQEEKSWQHLMPSSLS